MLITSVNNEHIKEIIKLKEKKYRDKENKFIVEGEHLVLEAFRAGLVDELILEQDTVFPLNVDDITYVSFDIIKKISDLESPSKVMAVVRKKKEEKILEKVLMLDNIQDPGNLGTIIRSALAFDIDTIILSLDSVDLYNPKVIRATQGMIFHLNIVRRDLKEAIDTLKSEGYKIVGTKVTSGKDVKTAKIYSHFALIMGNEGSGVKEELLKCCDEYLYIKTSDKVESLNVAVATSILIYEIYNK